MRSEIQSRHERMESNKKMWVLCSLHAATNLSISLSLPLLLVIPAVILVELGALKSLGLFNEWE